MELKFSDDVEAFREEVRSFIRENLPDDIRRKVAEDTMDVSREDHQRWHKILADKGWACPAWPEEYGGTGWSDEQSYVFEREMALNDAPRPMVFGVDMLVPTIIEFGTEEQKERFLPPIAKGDILWCQGFSEPNAGSDLASLQCKAELDGDVYVVNGTKTWTTDGHNSDWMFGLFRTESSGKKQQGITMLLLDLSTPGITMTPLVTFDGTHEINQVFFDNVRVPADNRLGDEHHGWTVGKYMLGLERFGTAEVSRSLASLGRLKQLAAVTTRNGAALIDTPAFAEKIGQAEVELRALELTEQRFLFQPGGADAMGFEACMLKVRGTEIQQRIYELAVEALGYGAHRISPDETHDPEDNRAPGDRPESADYATQIYFNLRKTSIYAGSNEIQKNIIAKTVLGLR